MKTHIRLIPVSFFLLLLSLSAQAAGQKEKAIEAKMSQPVSNVYGEATLYRYKLNTMLGLNVIQGSALVSGMQFGYALSPSSPLYVGPEFNFSLFSPGSIFSVMAGGWYEMRVHGAQKMRFSLGLVLGPGFNSAVSGVPATALVGFLDAALAQEMDDLMSIRAQFRPGMVGRFFAFMMNINISFRFL